MGTICGSNGIGVAPDALWITCRGCSSLGCFYGDLLECGEYFCCPSDNCELLPDVISNSWGGGQGDPFYDDIINCWRTCGIIPVFAIGNSVIN